MFIGYAALLAFMTHKPGVAVPLAELRTDLVVHVGAFSVWAALLVACGFFGAWRDRRNLILCWAIGVPYAIVDEATQAIPALRRVAAIEDGAANVLGIAVGVLACYSLARLRTTKLAPQPGTDDA